MPRLRRSVPYSTLLILLLLVQFALSFGYIIVTPLWQAHEIDFFRVVRFLADEGRLPTPEDVPAGEAEVRQVTQPPLFFLTAYPIVRLLDDQQPVPYGTQPLLYCFGDNNVNQPRVSYLTTPSYDWPVQGAIAAAYGLRLLNVVFGIAAVALTYASGRAFFPRQPIVALVGAAFLAFATNIIQMNVLIGNDTLFLLLSAANLYFCSRQITRKPKKLIDTGLILITALLALMTRLSGWSVLAVSLFVIAFVFARSVFRDRTWREVRLMLIALAVLVIGAIAVGLFNVAHYGSFLGRYTWLDNALSTSRIDLPSALDDVRRHA